MCIMEVLKFNRSCVKGTSELDVGSGGRELHMIKLALVPDSTGTALGLQQPSPLAALPCHSSRLTAVTV